MASLKSLIVEIHRRSLWQVLAVYLGASWIVLEVSDQVIDRYLLPEWVYGAAFVLLAVGLPIVLATAMVREDREPHPVGEPRDPTLLVDAAPPELAAPTARRRPPGVGRLLTWPRAILGGVLAFAGLGLVSALIVLQGTARVTDAEGAANETFSERAWIIVADFESLEEEADIALAAKTALTLDLQQSQYVNVRTRNQIAPVLRRMGLPDTTALDERMALDVAEREGLAGVLAASISRLGDDYVLGARVVQPGTGEDLIVVSVAAGGARLLEGVQSLSQEVRRRLGEEQSAIRRSRPLPEVTTRSLEALKTYARAAEANEARDFQRAAELAMDAIRLDTTFAMAYRLASVAHSNVGRISEGLPFAVRAYALRDRLTQRERLHVEARYYSLVDLDPRQAVAIYERLLSDYPDDAWAANNLGVMAAWLGDRERGYQAYRKALDLDPYSSIAFGNLIGAARFTDRMSAADSFIHLAEERGFGEPAARWRLDQAIAYARWDAADALCDSLLSLTSTPAQLADDRDGCGALDIARGRMRRGIRRTERAAEHRASRRQYLLLGLSVYRLALAEQMRGRPRVARSRIEMAVTRYPADSLGFPDALIQRTSLRVLAGVLGLNEVDDLIQDAYPVSDTTFWVTRFTARIGEGARDLGRGDAVTALESFGEARAFDASPPAWAVLLDFLSGLAFAEAGSADSAVAYLEAVAHPGLITEYSAALVQLPIVLRRLAELEETRGNTDAAIRHYQHFLELWADADPELRDQVAFARRALARLTGGETG